MSNTTSDQTAQAGAGKASVPDVEVIVVGAGFAGLYLLHRLRNTGFSAKAFETGDDVGGTWFWNRYPGARCDIQSIDYSYSFDAELETEWQWSEKYATQPEILRYLNHVADKHDLKRDVQFSTRVDAAVWDEATSLWNLSTNDGKTTSCRYYVMASGCLSLPKAADIPGTNAFKGEVYFTSRWPHQGVDFTGKRVGVIGTGSSGIQSIPLIAKQASALTVFQRTPNYSLPARNGAIPEAKLASIAGRYQEYRQEAKLSGGGVPGVRSEISALAVTEEERQAKYEEAWETGELGAFLGAYSDILVNPKSNDTVAEFIRAKIRATVKDPETAEALCPKDHPFGTKRPCLDSGYFETFNEPHVSLVDIRKHPIVTITETGLDTADETYVFDAIVFATGFDAMTGALVSVDITGREGVKLADKWAHGPQTYLGLTTVGFPNFFMVTGPGSPSVLSNMAVSIEQHVDWVTDTITAMRADGFNVIEPTETAETGWGLHVNDCANITLYPQANSWYMGANVPGKTRMFLPYIGGVDAYRKACDEVVAREYLGFAMSTAKTGTTRINDGIVRRHQPDVAFLLEFVGSLGMPPLESMSPADARAFNTMSSAARPQGPEVGEIVDGMYPGADGSGELPYRLYRPATPGPHPIVAYFHGGGWVLGSSESDDPYCRDLCVRSNAIIISCDYCHAPEARFPAAADDGYAAVQWIAANAASLGGNPGELAVSGWSAGANVAAVVCQTARDLGVPNITGQLLLTPVTDGTTTRASYIENSEGNLLTASLMDWFWDHYADPADRANPKASPLLAASLAGLPPAFIVTAEFDPLRDQGDAYAEALKAAGVPVHHIQARGHIHTSIPAVDVMLSGAPLRAEMAAGLKSFFGAEVRV
jgi:cation diffusion facilitator CzcD-associated flavoprotein CzcO/acetyl esterase/lipase